MIWMAKKTENIWSAISSDSHFYGFSQIKIKLNRLILVIELTQKMNLTPVFFNFIFYSNTSIAGTSNFVSLLQRDECINYCSSFYINAIPGVNDAQFIKRSRVAASFLNDTRFIKPIQFHTDINFDFNRKLWLDNNFLDRNRLQKIVGWSKNPTIKNIQYSEIVWASNLIFLKSK